MLNVVNIWGEKKGESIMQRKMHDTQYTFPAIVLLS